MNRIATFEGLKSLPVSVAIVDASGTIVAVNETWKRFGQGSPFNPIEAIRAAQRYLAKHAPDAENKVHVRMVRLEIDAVKL